MPVKNGSGLKQLEGKVSDNAIQVLIDLLGKYQAWAKIGEVLNKFAEANLQWVADEMKAANQLAIDLGIQMEPPANLTPAQQQQVRAIIADAQARWINSYGWLNYNPGTPQSSYDNENPSLFTGEYLYLLMRLGALTGTEQATWKTNLPKQVALMQLQPGLWDRFGYQPRPVEVEMFSHDEGQGLIMLDNLFGYAFGFAKNQQTYGAKYDYVYMNPAWSAPNRFQRPMVWKGQPVTKAQAWPQAQRYFDQVEEIRRTGGVATTLASDLVLCASFLGSLTQGCGQTSSPILMIQRAHFLKGLSPVLDGCIYQFKFMAEKLWAKGNQCGGITVTNDNAYGNMLQIYFPQYSDYPLRTLSSLLPPGAG